MVDKDFQSLAVWGKKLFKTMSWPPKRIRKESKGISSDNSGYILVSLAYQSFPGSYWKHQPRHDSSIASKVKWQIC